MALFEVPEEEPVEGLGEGAAEEFGVVDGLFVWATEKDDVAHSRGLRNERECVCGLRGGPTQQRGRGRGCLRVERERGRALGFGSHLWGVQERESLFEDCRHGEERGGLLPVRDGDPPAFVAAREFALRSHFD